MTKSVSLIGKSDNAVLDADKLSGILKITADNVTIKNLIFKNYHNKQVGLIEYKHASTIDIIGNNILIENCRFINNDAYYSVIHSDQLKEQNIYIKNCTFSDNKGSDVNCININNEKCNLSLVSYTFSRNPNEYSFNPIISLQNLVSVNITDCTFNNNTAKNIVEYSRKSIKTDNVKKINFNDCRFINEHQLFIDADESNFSRCIFNESEGFSLRNAVIDNSVINMNKENSNFELMGNTTIKNSDFKFTAKNIYPIRLQDNTEIIGCTFEKISTKTPEQIVSEADAIEFKN